MYGSDHLVLRHCQQPFSSLQFWQIWQFWDHDEQPTNRLTVQPDDLRAILLLTSEKAVFWESFHDVLHHLTTLDMKVMTFHII